MKQKTKKKQASRPYRKDGEVKVRCQVTLHTKDRDLLLSMGGDNLSGGIALACDTLRKPWAEQAVAYLGAMK